MRKWRDFSIRYKILSGYILIIVIFFLLGAVIVKDIDKVNKATREIESRNFTGLEIVNMIERSILTIKYLKAGDKYSRSESEIVKNYEEIGVCKNKIDLLFSEFENLVKNEPKTQKNGLVLKDLVQGYYILILKEKEQWLKEKTIFIHQNEKVILQLLDEKLGELRDNDINKFSAGFGHIGNLLLHARKIYFSGLLAALFIALFLGYSLAKIIVKPMKSLLQGMRKLADGDWSYKIKIQSNDEVGSLQAGFMRMASDLREVHSILEKQKEELEVRVIERTKEIKQLQEELEEESMELALGLSTIFEMLRKVAEGDLNLTVNDEFGNELLCKLAQVVNITIINLKKSWEDLETAKKYSENVIESIKDMIIVTDPDTRMRFINSAVINALKFPKEELIGKLIRVIFLEDIKSPKLIEAKNVITESELTNYEMFFRPQEGAEIPVILNYSIIKNREGDIIYKVYTAKDITERKRVENLVRENEERYRNLINISPEVITLLDPNLNIIMINKSGADLYGYADKKEMVGINISEFFEPEEMEIVLKNMKLVIQNGEIRDLELVSRKKDGSAFYIEVSAVWVMGNEKNKDNFLFLFSDISLRKQTEKELQNAYDKLKELQSQLVQTEKMAAIGQLAGGVAHEINNPLTGVLNNVQLIKMIVAQGDEFKMDEFKELLDIIEESAQRCQKITQSLLDFSHASLGKFNSLSLNELIDKVINLISNEMNLQNITIKKELQPDLPDIQGDSQLLQQVIINFFTNAKWAIQKKFKTAGGLITVKTEHSVNNGIITVSITDNGIGIEENKIKKIFEPFFTTKDVGEGTGLGLSEVYNIIKKHKGAISVESQANVGTTFKISIPCV